MYCAVFLISLDGTPSFSGQGCLGCFVGGGSDVILEGAFTFSGESILTGP